MIYPKKLEKSATVGLVCPSSAVSEERKQQCIRTVEELGYKVKVADNLTSNLGGYMAGSGKVRGEWINRMFADPEVNAIFCVRGGDGGTRAAEYIDLELVKANPKIFVGYSDVTTMHLLFNQKADLVTFHGPMVSSNMADGFDEESRDSFFAAINGEGHFEFKNPKKVSIKTLKEGKAEGRLTGGNLSILSASIGTPYELNTDGKIIFIEEVLEPITKIEKWIYHLRNAGKCAECKGVILGQFTKIKNDAEDYDYLCCIKDALEGVDIPVMYDIQSGHGEQIMTLPLGASCKMDTETGTIIFEE